MGEKLLTGVDLEKTLNDDTGLASNNTTLTGMVKKSETAGYIKFTRSGCDNWVDIPISLIEQAEKVGQAGCKDHSHLVYRIIFKKPKDMEAQLYARLLAEQENKPVATIGNSENLLDQYMGGTVIPAGRQGAGGIIDHNWFGPWAGCHFSHCWDCLERGDLIIIDRYGRKHYIENGKCVRYGYRPCMDCRRDWEWDRG